MKIQDYADALNLQLTVNRYPNQEGRWSCSFDGVEVIKGAVLESAHGNGASVDDAIYDYISKIKGKRIVINAMQDSRKEYDCPKDLEY